MYLLVSGVGLEALEIAEVEYAGTSCKFKVGSFIRHLLFQFTQCPLPFLLLTTLYLGKDHPGLFFLDTLAPIPLAPEIGKRPWLGTSTNSILSS